VAVNCKRILFNWRKLLKMVKHMYVYKCYIVLKSLDDLKIIMCELQLWTTNCIISSKLTAYTGFKAQYVTESYVNFLVLRKYILWLYRNVYATFPLSAHCLAIERGRYSHIDKESRFCPYCKNILLKTTFFKLPSVFDIRNYLSKLFCQSNTNFHI